MRSIFQRIATLLTGNILSSVLRALTLVLLARLIAPAEFAIYTGIFGILVILKSVSDLGIHKYILSERARCADSPGVARALKINNTTSLALLVVSASGLFLFSYLSAWQFLPLVFLSVVTAFEKNADTWFCVLIADNEVRVVSVDRTVRRMISLGLFLLFVSLNWGSPLAAIVVGDLVASFVSNVWSKRLVSRRIPPLTDRGARDVLSGSLPYWINGLAMNTKWLDVAMVGVLATPVQSGFFAVASRISGPLRMIPLTMAPILISHASRGSDVSKRSLLVIVGAVTGAFMVLAAICLPFISWAVELFLGPQYSGSIIPMQIIILALPVQVFGGLSSAILQGAGLSRNVSSASIGYVIVYLFLLAIGAYLGGSSGAAWATLISQLVFALLLVRPGLGWLRNGV